MAARRCLTVGAACVAVCSSIHAATCSGCTAVDRRHTSAGAPGKEVGCGARTRGACGGCGSLTRKTPKAHAGPFASGNDQCRRRNAIERRELVHEPARIASTRASTMYSRWLASRTISKASISILRCECANWPNRLFHLFSKPCGPAPLRSESGGRKTSRAARAWSEPHRSWALRNACPLPQSSGVETVAPSAPTRGIRRHRDRRHVPTL